MDIKIFIIATVLYMGILFGVAYLTDRRRKRKWSSQLVANPYIYSLSLAIYCTAWTFYGSVGKATKSGVGFLPIYLGPTILAPLWWLILRKMIVISKNQRITSIADFISSRYGKSTYLGILVTLIALFGIVPYISLQLKAISDSLNILSPPPPSIDGTAPSIFESTTFYVTIILAAFAMLFGTRQLEPNERHEGMVIAIAFESIIKLFSFLAVGIFVTYYMYDGFGDLFTKALSNERTAKMLFVNETAHHEWFWLSILSMFAIILLPRQFHLAVVENADPAHVNKAMWLVPLYLLIINIFVLPIAIAGILQFGNDPSVFPDSYVLDLPLSRGQDWLTMLVFIGGFSAATGMVIVETTALSIMLSNHVIMPPLITTLARRSAEKEDFSQLIIWVRRGSILILLLLAFGYVRTIANSRELVSIGLISFAAVAQFAPAVIGGLFWKTASKSGAVVGLIVGFCIWAITLPIPVLAENDIVWSKNLVTEGYFGQWWLRPYALLGLETFGTDHISHAAFWSLLLNTSLFCMVSLFSQQTTAELSQADTFVNIYKYMSIGNELEVMRRRAKVEDLVFLMNRFLGEERHRFLIKNYEYEYNVDLSTLETANADLVNYVETILAGALGAASARILLGTVVTENPISIDEMLRLLDQTQEIIVNNKVLETTSNELQALTQQLQAANEQLQQLDTLKADFITTVTHELRTPMTSLRAMSKILLDNPDLPIEKRNEFLKIVVSETERITRLVNQVLDIEQFDAGAQRWNRRVFDFTKIVKQAHTGIQPVCQERRIECIFSLETEVQSIKILGDEDRMTQVLVNLLSNAVKFTAPENGKIWISLEKQGQKAILKVANNGTLIADEQLEFIFGRFTQINSPTQGKPTGSGLGLFITRKIIDFHKGKIWATNVENTAFWVEIPVAEGA